MLCRISGCVYTRCTKSPVFMDTSVCSVCNNTAMHVTTKVVYTVLFGTLFWFFFFFLGGGGGGGG